MAKIPNKKHHNLDLNRTEDVSLGPICDRNSYCTRHSDTDTPQYVHIGVPITFLLKC
jgi:hypothetical protein